MLLEGKVALIHGGSGAIGGAAARVFAREGAHVFLAARQLERVQAVADAITAAGGRAEAASLDVLDAQAVSAHVDAVVAQAGHLDIALNAVGFIHVQGTAFDALSLDDFMHPVEAYLRACFIVAQAVARPMTLQGGGVILTLSTPGAKLAGQGFLGNGVASAAVEAFSRLLAAELGGHGIRTVCLRPDAIPEAVPLSHTGKVFAAALKNTGIGIGDALSGRAHNATLLKRLPTLAQVAETAAFIASDRASAMTGTVANLTCGSLVD